MNFLSNYLLNRQNMFLKNNTNLNTSNTQQAEKTQQRPSFGSMTMPNNKLQNSPEADTCSFSMDNQAEIAKNFMKSVPMLYMVGFAIGLCPGLALLATGMFLFSNKGQSFMEKLSNTLVQGGMAGKVQDAYNQTQAKQNQEPVIEQTPQTTEKKVPQQKQKMLNAAPEQKMLNAGERPLMLETSEQPLQIAEHATKPEALTTPVKPEVTKQAEAQEKELTPLDKAQTRFAKAQDYEAKAEMNLAKKEQAQLVAQEKYDLAKAQLEKAQQEYNEAKTEIKTQMTEKLTRLQKSVYTKGVNLEISKQKVEVAKATLEEARVKVADAQTRFEYLQAEEMVAV